MKYFLNKQAESNNLIVVFSGLLLIGSCEEENYEAVELQFFQGLPIDDILPKSEAKILQLDSFQKLSSRSTDDDIDVSYLSEGKESEVTLNFETSEQKQLCLIELKKRFPAHLIEHEYQQGRMASISPSFFSAIFVAFAFFLFYEKLPKTSYIIGGICLTVSFFIMYKRFSAPPVVTQWALHKSKISQGIGFLKQAYAWGLLLVAMIVGSQVLPNDSGQEIIYDHAVKEVLSVNNIAELLEKEGDINFQGDEGKTALHHLIDQASYRAYEISDSLVAAALLKAATGKKLLNKEKLRNEPEQVALALINAGADLSVIDSGGISIMQYAVETYAEDALSTVLFEAMLEKGAKLGFVMDEDNMSPQEYVRDNTEQKLLDKKHLADLFEQYQ